MWPLSQDWLPPHPAILSTRLPKRCSSSSRRHWPSKSGPTMSMSQALSPGFTYSEFHDVLGTRDLVRQQVPRWMWMDADTVARPVFDAVMAGRSVCVTGHVNRSIAFLTRHLPDGVLHRIAQRQGVEYRRV